ncbi:MAG: response regulator transcription factor [Taibaiella sp.]|jgi:DNA-binding NarL/FixJ family response regulator
MVYGSILIADDHEVVRGGLAILVKRVLPQMNILQTESLDGALEFLKEYKADLMLCDINMPGGNSFDMLHRLRAIQPDLKILIITAFQTASYEKKYLQEGANGYLSKTATNEEIQQAILSILQDGYYQGSMDIAKGSSENNKTSVSTDLLSYREMEVCRLLTKGLGILEISNALNIQSNTVSTFKKRIFKKLKVTNIPELVSLLNSDSDYKVD